MDVAGAASEATRSIEKRDSDGAGDVFTGVDYSTLLKELEVGLVERCVCGHAGWVALFSATHV